MVVVYGLDEGSWLNVTGVLNFFEPQNRRTRNNESRRGLLFVLLFEQQSTVELKGMMNLNTSKFIVPCSSVRYSLPFILVVYFVVLPPVHVHAFFK